MPINSLYTITKIICLEETKVSDNITISVGEIFNGAYFEENKTCYIKNKVFSGYSFMPLALYRKNE